MDVVYLAFCNSSTEPLPSLTREADQVHSILINRGLRGDFFIHLDQHATIEKINRDLDLYRDRLALFLYSGHAGRDALLLDDQQAHGGGIAAQLAQSARLGKLKLVLLNGCSTLGQVDSLQAAGVPAIIATSAPVEDKSATEFSIRFFKNITDNRMGTREAFEDALNAAQAATTAQDLRSMGRQRTDGNPTPPVWICEGDTDANPLPLRSSARGPSNYIPNEQLTDALYESLLQAGNDDILDLRRQEERGNYVEMGEKQTRIVNVLPYPVGVHLQKLLCPTHGEEEEGYDKPTLRRLERIGWLYYSTVELLAWIMVSQLWEECLTEPERPLPPGLLDTLRPVFHMPAKERQVFDYIPFIRSIRLYFDSLNEGAGIAYFVEELARLKEAAKEGHPFAQACAYLHRLHQRAIQKQIPEDAEVPYLGEESERQLCAFFAEMGFLHRYILTSAKNIDIQHYRHLPHARFNYLMAPLMRAVGQPEDQKYYLDELSLHNRGILLLKWIERPRIIDIKKKQFEGGKPDFLNLSPFIFDRNAFGFGEKSDLLAFEQYHPDTQTFQFKSVKRPDQPSDQVMVGPGDERYDAVHLQLEAFRQIILLE